MIFGSSPTTGAQVKWDTASLANPHVGFFGDTGMGKTTMLCKLAEAMEKTGHSRVRMHIFDAHGDVEIPGESSVRFHESAGFGFNPLELNSDKEFGGVRKRIESLTAAINATSVRLGPRQERVLSKLLTGLYKRHGFLFDQPESWMSNPAVGKNYPTLVDAIAYGKDKIKSMFIGAGQRGMLAFEEVNRLVRQIRLKEAALNRSDDGELGRLESELDSAKERAVMAYREALSGVQSGEELDELLEFDGQEETIRSVVDRLENLYAIGIYKSIPPPLDPRARVWRYIITSLSTDAKKLFTTTRLETIFTRAVQRGVQHEISDVVVIDEAHLYQDKNEDYVINRMVREVRKFGVAMVFSSQSPADFADILLSNLGTKVTLGLDPNYWPLAMRKLGLLESDLKFIVPRRRIVVQMKNIGESRVGAHHVIL